MTIDTAEKPRGNKPVHEIADGLLKAAIWQQDGGEYGPQYSVTFRRRYKDGEEWKDSHSYGHDDLLALGELARDAYRWIGQRRRADREARREKQAETADA
jgi:hypothetical protein